ncbi:MAG: hypothetical protein ACKOW2_03595 [Sphingobacteriaceae bacterium]
MKKTFVLLIIGILLGIFIIACRKNNSKFYVKLNSLDHLPIAMNEFTALVPMGFVSPPGHIFPNDHMGLYYEKAVSPVIIYAPGNLHITELRGNIYNPGEVDETSDYAISFGVNGESTLVFGHISQLSPKLKAAFGNYSACEQYQVGAGIVKACRKSVSMEVISGEIIGYSNMVQGQQALDLGMFVNNEPVSPLAYFTASIRADLESRIMGAPNAEYDGIKRTALPLAGEWNHDVAGTLQGNWIQQGFAKEPEINNIAFVKNYINPAQLRISFGNSQPVFGPGYWKFDQQNTGQINRAFVDVKPDGKIYCYDPLFLNGGGFPNNSFLVKMENNTTIAVETRDCNCSTNLPYVFTTAKKIYSR